MIRPKLVYLDNRLAGDIECFLVEIKRAGRRVSFSRYTELALRVLTIIAFNLKRVPGEVEGELRRADPRALEELEKLIDCARRVDSGLKNIF